MSKIIIDGFGIPSGASISLVYEGPSNRWNRFGESVQDYLEHHHDEILSIINMWYVAGGLGDYDGEGAIAFVDGEYPISSKIEAKWANFEELMRQGAPCILEKASIFVVETDQTKLTYHGSLTSNNFSNQDNADSPVLLWGKEDSYFSEENIAIEVTRLLEKSRQERRIAEEKARNEEEEKERKKEEELKKASFAMTRLFKNPVMGDSLNEHQFTFSEFESILSGLLMAIDEDSAQLQYSEEVFTITFSSFFHTDKIPFMLGNGCNFSFSDKTLQDAIEYQPDTTVFHKFQAIRDQ